MGHPNTNRRHSKFQISHLEAIRDRLLDDWKIKGVGYIGHCDAECRGPARDELTPTCECFEHAFVGENVTAQSRFEVSTGSLG